MFIKKKLAHPAGYFIYASAVRSYPDNARAVQVDRSYIINAQRPAVKGIVKIGIKPIFSLIKYADPAAVGAYPDHTAGIITESINLIIADRPAVSEGMYELLKMRINFITIV